MGTRPVGLAQQVFDFRHNEFSSLIPEGVGSLGSPKVEVGNGEDTEDDAVSKQYVDIILRFSTFDLRLTLRSNLVNKGRCLLWKNVGVAAKRTMLSNVAGEITSTSESRNLPL